MNQSINENLNIDRNTEKASVVNAILVYPDATQQTLSLSDLSNFQVPVYAAAVVSFTV